jgi:GTP diphosphokinase / guanosine-3',5'-bis(diphosphate) 3'-diphosphatase
MDIQTLIEAVTSYTDSSEEIEPILTEAFQIASEAHNGCKRISGDPYVNHSLAVASILSEWHAPVNIVAVALLHDIHSLHYSQGYDLNCIRIKLGSDIFWLLKAMISLNRYIQNLEGEFTTLPDINKILQQDRDIVIIKLADRLHNLQTISSLTRDSQGRAARTGFNLLAPLAHRLGMGSLKLLFEDYSFEAVNPTYHKMLKQQCEEAYVSEGVNVLTDELQQAITTYIPNAEARWQFDSLYAMYLRQLEHNSKLGNPLQIVSSPVKLVDAGFFVIRLLSDEEVDCYRCLWSLHKHYTPVNGQLGKYNNNGYQSLHTQVKHPSGNSFRVSIRTRTMDLIAERGITATWWNVPEELLPRLSNEIRLVSGEIQVVTPKGEIKKLPSGATTIDFAYAVHSDVGNHCIGVMINGKQGDVKQPLQDGDRVEIISGGQDAEPQLDWLEFVKSHQASHGIRQWFMKNRRNEMIELGRSLLDGELQPLNLTSTDKHVWQQLTRLAVREQMKGAKDLLVSIALKRHKASKIVRQLQFLQAPKYVESDLRVNSPSPAEHILPRVYARCCNPLPPTEIVGIRSKDHLIIHRANCSRIEGQEELTPVEWDTIPREPNYIVIVEAYNRQGLTTDLSNAISLLGVDMQSFNFYLRADEVLADAYIYLGKTTSAERTRIKEALDNVLYVTHVELIHSSLPPVSTKQSLSLNSIYYSNPYGPNLATGRRFYGREVECKRIFTQLHDQSQNIAILLWGQKRIGKSSLLIRLEELLQGHLLPVFIDVQGLSDASTTQFIHHLMQRIAEILKEKIIEEITVPSLNKIRKDTLAHFDTFMALVQKNTRYQPIVIILDEFQCLCSLREETISREAIFNRLRSQSQYGCGIHLILSGGGLQSQLNGQCALGSLFNISYDQRLGCLGKVAAKQLIIDGLSKIATITEDSIDFLLSITAGHPFYLQLLCKWLYEQAQENKTNFTREITSNLVQEWIRNADNSRFQHLWETSDTASTKRNKIILSAIAQLGTATHEVEYSRLETLVKSTITEAVLVQTLSDLSDLGILKHNRLSYSIEVELFADWLRQHYPLQLVLKEAY